jgi:exonuclease VII small subunit
LYEEVIEVALKDLFDHFWQEQEYPSYDQYMVAARDAFWGARMEQMCCQLDKDVALPPCVEPVAHLFMSTYGCDDDEIPSSIGRENFIIDVPTQTGTQWSPESLSGDEEDDSKAAAIILKRQAVASAKCASGRESDEDLRIPYANELATDGPVYKSPEFHRTLRASLTQLDKGEVELDEAFELYRNASWRTPPKSASGRKLDASGEKLDAALNEYEEAENSGTFRKEHLENVLSQYSEDISEELVSSGTTTSDKSKNKKARFEVLAQGTSSEEEEEGTKPAAAKKPKNNHTGEDIEDPEEKDPKFSIVKRRRRNDPQLTLTQFWPDSKMA